MELLLAALLVLLVIGMGVFLAGRRPAPPPPRVVRILPPRAPAGRSGPTPAERRQLANTQNRLFQTALLQLSQAPDFRRAATVAAAATAVPVAFRRRQFARFRPALVAHVARCLAAGTEREVLAQSLRDLVVALGVAPFEADYIQQAARTASRAARPRPASTADRMAQLRAEHETRVNAIRQGVPDDGDLREQLLEAEEQRYRDVLLAVVDDRTGEPTR